MNGRVVGREFLGSRRAVRRAALIATAIVGALFVSVGDARGQSADALMRLLRSGRLPAERLGNVIDAIGKRGSAADLGYLLQRATEADGFPAEVRLATLEALAEAARSRGVVPEAEPTRLVGLLGDDDPAVRSAAVRIAGRWRDGSFVSPLATLVADPATSERSAAEGIEALGAIGDATAIEALTAVMNGSASPKRRTAAAAALVASGDETASIAALDVALGDDRSIDPAGVVQAFLARQGGAERLAALLGDRTIDAERAQLMLRGMYSIGRSDAALVTLLTERAGLEDADADWSAEKMAETVARIAERGDAARGELVFRRRDLTCFNCHALSGAGGAIGPDLSAVGNSSPPDYLINALLRPEQDVKEVYRMYRVLTIDGLLVAGVKLSEDDQSIVLKDAEGKTHVIPQEDIEDLVEGGSLMPRGLKVLMTDAEFDDLIAFLYALGRPGDYAVRSRATIQRWKVAGPNEVGLNAAAARGDEGLARVAAMTGEGWPSLYGKVAGGLPLAEAAAVVDGETLFLRGEVDVVVGGEVTFAWNGPAAELRIDEVSWQDAATPIRLEPGRHRVTIRLSRDACDGDASGEFVRPAGSPIEFTVVGGS